MSCPLPLFSALACALALGLACDREPEPAYPIDEAPRASGAPPSPIANPSPAAAASEAEVRTRLESLGDEGVAIVVLRPWHWPALHDALSPWLAALPPESGLAELLMTDEGAELDDAAVSLVADSRERPGPLSSTHSLRLHRPARRRMLASSP